MVRLFALSLILSVSGFAFAKGPDVSFVISGNCQGSSSELQRNSATLVSFSTVDISKKPRVLVVAGDPTFADSEIATTCFWLSQNSEKGAALRLLKRDSRMGLMLLEPKDVLREAKPVALTWSQYRENLWMGDFPVQVITTDADRHFFPQNLALHEYRSSRSDLDFTLANGAPIGEGGGVFAILSDESLLLRPGQAARPIRSRDLRYQPQSSMLHRLAFKSHDVYKWIQNILAGSAKIELVPLSRPVGNGNYSKTLWSVRGQRVREVCERGMSTDVENNAPIGGWKSDSTRLLLDPSVLKDLKIDPKQFEIDPKDFKLGQENKLGFDPLFQTNPEEQTLKPLDQTIQSGGIEPVGIGGLQNLLSDCRLASVSEAGETRAILLAYQRTDGYLRAHSLLNVQNLMNLQDSREWKFLIQEDFLKGRQGALEELRKTSIAAQVATLNLYHTGSGNPLTIRQAFLISSLLNTRDWKEVTSEDIGSLINEIENEMPLYLADDDLRGDSDTEEFSRRKTQLVDALKRLKGAREKCP